MGETVKITLSQRKRAAIVQAAIEAFQEKGAQCTSMDSIAERAQVSKRTVYNHFASKERLLEEVFELWLHQCFDLDIAP
ncbi:MAG: TetR/AcrR family transcriptional regulator, partial [Pseudomonadales bacterium]